MQQKLLALGFTKKDGPFMAGSYFPTFGWSPKEEWTTHWVTERSLTKKEAEKLYELAKKAGITYHH